MAHFWTDAGMSTSIVVGIISGVITIIISVSTTAVMVGVKWGKLSNDVDNMKTDLAEIKGMFRLTLKE